MCLCELRCRWKMTNTPRGSTQRLTMGKRVKRHAHQRTSNQGYLALCASQATCQATKGRTPSGGHPSRPEKVQPDQAGYSVSPQRVALALKARTAQVCGPVPQAAPSRCVPTMPAETTVVSQPRARPHAQAQKDGKVNTHYTKEENYTRSACLPAVIASTISGRRPSIVSA